MKELITDELIEKFAERYQELKEHMLSFAGVEEEHVMTFEQYVESKLKFRESLTRKALDYIEAKKT